MDHENVTIIFVVPSNCESYHQTSDVMQQAFDACKQNTIDCKWHTEEECSQYQSLKTDFFIFQEFSGTIFNKIRLSKSVRILGPWCLLTCLTEGKKIPNFSWPIYSAAMMGCTVAFSSLTKIEKKDLQEKVEYMGGYVLAGLMESCTHLVTNSVKSEKYIKAAEAGKKIMLNSWVTDVWEASLKANVHGNNEQFKKHACPVFYNLVVCCTGLSNVQRNDLRQLVSENGGIYREQLHVHKTDIVITESRTPSAKYKAAKKYNIKCVTMMWVIDSIKNGYAMPDTAYQIQVGTSTPTKEGEDLPNFSMISNIGNASEFTLRNGVELSETIDSTQVTKINTPIKATPSLKRKSNSNEHNELVDEINLKEVKKAGAFLDGCGIYLVGFGTEQREKLCKILNFSGATRYNDISERVTHVVVGDESCSELKYLRSKNILSHCPIVNVHWLLASLNKKSPVEEENFLLGKLSNASNEPGSPLSKKSLHLLQAVPEIVLDVAPDISTPASLPPSEMDIVQQYLQTNLTDKEDTLARILTEDNKFNTKPDGSLNIEQQKSVTTSKTSMQLERDASLSSAIDEDSSQQPESIFQGLKFLINGFTQEERKQVKLAIEEMSGTVVPKTYKGVCDYAVVPTFRSILKNAATHIVNDLWITECLHENEIRPIEYFHQPISVDENAKPLQDCVVTLSTYTNYERNFLKNLIVQLGGVCQELLSRIDTKNGLKACTHLVSPEATGKKYTAAVKWGLPVINKDWLLECAQTSKYVSETPFLVGDARPSLRCVTNSVNESSTSNLKTHVTSNKLISSSTTETTSTLAKNQNLEQSRLNTTPLQQNNSIHLAEEPKVPTPKIQSNQFNTPPQRTSASGSAEQTPLARKWSQCGMIGSQITPVQKIIAEARRQKLLGTPEQSLPRPLEWDHVDTPETPLGNFIDPDPSPNLRKQMCRFLNTFPDFKPRRDSTPLTELKRRLWDKIAPPKDENIRNNLNFDVSGEDVSESVENVDNISTPPKMIISDNLVNDQLKKLQDMLTASGGNRSEGRRSTLPLPPQGAELKDSQPNTVGWDECTQEDRPGKRVFMFSGVDQDKRAEMIPQLESLGATVSTSLNFDPHSTHLICSKPSRNEKILASMSAGKWILHESYVEQSVLKGKFVDEELFEFGNPKSSNNVHMQNEKENDSKLAAVHFWRKEVARRGYGAFHDMRLLVVAQKRDPLIRVLQAGGGLVIDERPPFTKSVHATHCLLDLKSVSDIADYIPLAQQGIFCVNTLYVNDFLLKNGIDVRDYIIPYLSEYYES